MLACIVLKLKYPHIPKVKNQLSKFEVDTSRKLSRVRIHVERVIGVLRQKYTILQSVLPISMIMGTPGFDDYSMIDKIYCYCVLCSVQLL